MTISLRTKMLARYDAYARIVRLRRVYGHRRGKWRWDVTFYRKPAGAHGPLTDLVHLYCDMGYTRTRIGALLALGRSAAHTPPDWASDEALRVPSATSSDRRTE